MNINRMLISDPVGSTIVIQCIIFHKRVLRSRIPVETLEIQSLNEFFHSIVSKNKIEL